MEPAQSASRFGGDVPEMWRMTAIPVVLFFALCVLGVLVEIALLIPAGYVGVGACWCIWVTRETQKMWSRERLAWAAPNQPIEGTHR